MNINDITEYLTGREIEVTTRRGHTLRTDVTAVVPYSAADKRRSDGAYIPPEERERVHLIGVAARLTLSAGAAEDLVCSGANCLHGARQAVLCRLVALAPNVSESDLRKLKMPLSTCKHA
ncbi:MAG: hypothetical protein LUC22_02315 [Prevotella sp.]|nr:hypothetical protein [Prevotella sp.]